MTARTVFVFPGQGAYVPGIFGELAPAHPVVGETLDIIDSVCGEYAVKPPSPLLLQSDAPRIEELLATDADRLQMAILGTSLALHELLTTVYGVRPDVLVGHSLGEITALIAAGAYSIADGARLLCERDAVMRLMAPAKGGLTALGLSAGRVEHMLGACSLPGVDIAAYNGPRQTVVSAPEQELLQIERVAEAMGVTRVRLNSPHLFHNKALEPVARHLLETVRPVPVSPLRTPVFSTLHGRHYTDRDDIPAMLACHLTYPVDYLAAVRGLHADGADFFVECGAGHALAGLTRGAVGQVQTFAPLDRRVDAAAFEELIQRLPGFERPGPRAEPVTREPVTDVPEQPVRVAVPPARNGGSTERLDRAAVLQALRTMYANALEYPEEVLTDDADLEADLGVDSLKQTELLSRVRDLYGLSELPADFRITEYTTLPAVAGLILSGGGSR